MRLAFRVGLYCLFVVLLTTVMRGYMKIQKLIRYSIGIALAAGAAAAWAGNPNLTSHGASGSISIDWVSGGAQSAEVKKAFSQVLRAKVSANEPLWVTFQLPDTGASARFTGGGTRFSTWADNQTGIATTPALTANAVPGDWTATVTISRGNQTKTSELNLTNAPAPAKPPGLIAPPPAKLPPVGRPAKTGQ